MSAALTYRLELADGGAAEPLTFQTTTRPRPSRPVAQRSTTGRPAGSSSRLWTPRVVRAGSVVPQTCPKPPEVGLWSHAVSAARMARKPWRKGASAGLEARSVVRGRAPGTALRGRGRMFESCRAHFRRKSARFAGMTTFVG